MLLELGGTVRFTHATAGRGPEARTMLGPCNPTLKTCLLVPHIPRSVWEGLRMNGGFQEFGMDVEQS